MLFLVWSEAGVWSEARPERLAGGRQEADRRGVLVRGAQATRADIAAEAQVGREWTSSSHYSSHEIANRPFLWQIEWLKSF